MKQIILFIVFVCALELCSASTFEIDPPVEKPTTEKGEEEEDSPCTTAGLTCRNCTELINCIEIEEGHFIEVGVKTCSSQESCLINKCSTSPNPQCSVNGLNAFQCHNTGVYPDPSNCRVYHMCVEPRHNLKVKKADKPEHIGVKCDDDYGYNPVTTYCDVKLPTGKCENLPVPACDTLGQMGGVSGTSIFYVCTEEADGTLVADLFMCPAGSKFEDGSCD